MIPESGHWPDLFPAFEDFGRSSEAGLVKIGQKCGQLAIFILKVARLEPLIYKGLRANWPDGHFFLYLFKKKNFI